jgi:outer membrane protein assembly factor BamB
LRVESGGEIYTVTLGPGWYLRRQGADYKIGDKLAVKGSKMKTQEGKLYLTAAKIKNLRTGHLLELRDENGLPLWKSTRRFDKEGSREGKP